ncbi:kinesin motor domain-containing protein [Cardiosporidium cionae]|uniref:Kinesin-like protein n=1 Tax=Cardiosporidium cionae TaxID=476202 RepID=A0ABQ7JCA1_9APIC|nr:kinesin motor domain-containing protein [Cardiosporidium cionae]|eukprot:KAF8821642.1 kinesin motor domain-containing protein [Cardiosporidium cionae]
MPLLLTEAYVIIRKALEEKISFIEEQMNDLQSKENEKNIERDNLLILLKNNEEKYNVMMNLFTLRQTLQSMQSNVKTKEQVLESMKKSMHEIQNRLSMAERAYQVEATLKRRLSNQLLDIKGKIRVYCRIRPMNSIEMKSEMKAHVETMDESQIKVEASKLNDLLIPAQIKNNPLPLDIKKEANGLVTVTNATLKTCTTWEEMYSYYKCGISKRTTAATDLNTASSRSHLIFSIHFQIDDVINNFSTSSKLTFIDLAGSERISKSGAANERLEEARKINKSLSALADVICALSTGAERPTTADIHIDKFVPYRNNKLTMLLSDSLGGTSRTLMFVNLSPAAQSLDETFSSLQYASRVRLIVNQIYNLRMSSMVQQLTLD